MCAVEDDGGERPLGLYVTAEEAATARDEALLRQNGLGNRAVLNHPVDDYQHVSFSACSRLSPSHQSASELYLFMLYSRTSTHLACALVHACHSCTSLHLSYALALIVVSLPCSLIDKNIKSF